MIHHSITPEEIDDHIVAWAEDRYAIRAVNGNYGQHWAVCDAKTWNIITLSYTEEEARDIVQEFTARSKGRRKRA